MAKSELRERLLYQPKNGYDTITEEEREQMERYCEAYKIFLDMSKTEREAVATAVYLAETHDFRAWEPNATYKAGDKIYYVNREKAIILAVIGEESLAGGVNIAVAHTDAPRLDLKPTPLYEDSELAFFKTHYYGGIRKYQWLNTPLVLHGVVMLADGSKVVVKIGDAPDEPQLIIGDLAPHLGYEQGEKPLDKAIPGETLNVLVGGRPLAEDDGKDRVKLEILRLLNEKYGITEQDFASAELEIVPAANARDVGLDRSFIGAYGHDDRVCAYAELAAMLELETPKKTAVCIFADKEETGSDGVSGMQSQAFERFMRTLCQAQGVQLDTCFANSYCISADVTHAYNPTYPEVYDRRNAAKCNYGIAFAKYTGARGKSGASDASAEVVGYITRLLNRSGVRWQIADGGRIDLGGGGTVSKYMANRNIDTIDAGVPVLSMHAPYEIVAKLDCYMTYRCMKALFED